MNTPRNYIIQDNGQTTIIHMEDAICYSIQRSTDPIYPKMEVLKIKLDDLLFDIVLQSQYCGPGPTFPPLS
jgi:hypothetical protein